MCFWQSKYSERGCPANAGHRHWNHRKHLNQNDARTRSNSSKIGLAKSDTNLNFTVYLHLMPTLADEIIFVEKGGMLHNVLRVWEVADLKALHFQFGTDFY